MNAKTIDLLASLDPANPGPGVLSIHGIESSPFHDVARDRFLTKYLRPSYGYYVARQFANYGKRFPICLSGRDLWVHKAYLMHVDPWRNFNKDIAEAFHISKEVNNSRDIGDVVKSLLVAYDPTDTVATHISRVARRLGVRANVIDAFEVLFYNVLDRYEDAVYLAREVYPNGRVVEFDESYLKNSAHADIIKRVAYNHKDMDLTSYLSGIGDRTYLRKLASSDNREADLTKYIIGNGLLLTHTNLMNQRSIGMSRSTTLLAASRQGGSVVEEPPLGGVAPLFDGAFQAAIKQSQEQAIAQIRADAGSDVADTTL